ncbi:hypothetical protein [Romboutsia lituseburensis]|uniref:hypothetical protein n=1 Tax=Romboutsia lituseburensis TaxID=1537 RepID=UPI0022EB11EE|nr:hypothetical protein [Romboutsia lituseburensis]
MSIKSQARELTNIARVIIEEKGLDIKQLLDNDDKKKIDEIWIQAVRVFDKNNKEKMMM